MLEFTTEPVKADIVRPAPGDVVHHHPSVVLEVQDAAPVNAAPRVAPEPIVLSGAEGAVRLVLEVEQPGIGPVQVLELAMEQHLVVSVDRESVVTCGAREVRVPLRWSVIEEAPGVDEDVQSPPEDVEVEHVDLGEAIPEAPAAKHREARGVSAA